MQWIEAYKDNRHTLSYTHYEGYIIFRTQHTSGIPDLFTAKLNQPGNFEQLGRSTTLRGLFKKLGLASQEQELFDTNTHTI